MHNVFTKIWSVNKKDSGASGEEREGPTGTLQQENWKWDKLVKTYVVNILV